MMYFEIIDKKMSPITEWLVGRGPYIHCKDSRVVLTLLWLSLLQNRYCCAAEVFLPLRYIIYIHNIMLMGLSNTLYNTAVKIYIAFIS